MPSHILEIDLKIEIKNQNQEMKRQIIPYLKAINFGIIMGEIWDRFVEYARRMEEEREGYFRNFIKRVIVDFRRKKNM